MSGFLSEVWGVGMTVERRMVDEILEVIGNMFWTLVGRKCRHIATAGIRTELGHCARLVQRSILSRGSMFK